MMRPPIVSKLTMPEKPASRSSTQAPSRASRAGLRPACTVQKSKVARGPGLPVVCRHQTGLPLATATSVLTWAPRNSGIHM